MTNDNVLKGEDDNIRLILRQARNKVRENQLKFVKLSASAEAAFRHELAKQSRSNPVRVSSKPDRCPHPVEGLKAKERICLSHPEPVEG